MGDCPLDDDEARDFRRKARQAAMQCFKCGQLGHLQADCPSNTTDVHINVTEVSDAVSEVSEHASTVATALDLPKDIREPKSCSFCGAMQCQVRSRKGVKVRRD